MPLNAVAEEGSFMMLFTGPELLELARPSLQQLGAFNVATNVQPAQVPAKKSMAILTTSRQEHLRATMLTMAILTTYYLLLTAYYLLQVPAKNVYECLCAADAMHAGVAVNVYVPGLDARYMAPALRKGPLCRLFAHHEAEAEAEAARQPTSTQKAAAPHAESRAWSQTNPTNQETLV